ECRNVFVFFAERAGRAFGPEGKRIGGLGSSPGQPSEKSEHSRTGFHAGRSIANPPWSIHRKPAHRKTCAGSTSASVRRRHVAAGVSPPVEGGTLPPGPAPEFRRVVAGGASGPPGGTPAATTSLRPSIP